MTGHQARAYRTRDGWRRWFVHCPKGCRLPVPEDKQDAEDIAEQHERQTTCRCYDPGSVEWSPEPCESCAGRNGMNRCEHVGPRSRGSHRCVCPAGHNMLHQYGPMKRVSDKRALLERQYRTLRLAFLAEHPLCQFPAESMGAHTATEIQHKRGRVGADYLDTSTWAALCGWHHRWVTEHPAAAVELGMSERRIR